MKKKPKYFYKGHTNWRNEILKRDSYTCRFCGKKPSICKMCGKKESLEVHHILPSRYFPKYKYILKNGITLCHKCHHKIPKNIEKVFKKINVNLFLQ